MIVLKYTKLLAVSLLIVALQINCMENNLLKKVLIFHATNKNNIPSILKEGLKTKVQLVKKNKVELIYPVKSFRIFDRFSKVYFMYIDPRELDKVENSVWKWKNSDSDYRFVAIKVDPNETFVFNSELRLKKPNSYYDCKITLSSYLERLKKKKELQKHIKPGQFIISNFCTAKPIIVREFDPRRRDNIWKYLHEIIFNHNISPERLAP